MAHVPNTASIHRAPKPRAAAPGEVHPQHAKIVKGAQQLVSQTFYGTLLKQMHDSPFKSKIFDGGRGGQAFGAMLDQKLADHMSLGKQNKLVNALVKQIEKKSKDPNKPEDPKTAALRSRFEKAGYGKSKPANRRQNVKADFRA